MGYKAIDVSIVIPAHNESRKIGRDIREAAEFCQRHGFAGEIFLVDDGSEDGTAEVAEQLSGAFGCELHILRLAGHRGKGYAVRQGMIRSHGDFILFIDSGGCIPYEEILRGLDRIKSGECEIAHASRRLPDSVILRQQRPSRRLSAWLFRHIFTWLLGLRGDLTDTQAGLKIYRGDAGRRLYEACRSEGFLFDAEIILLAQRAGYRICEFPVTWTSDPDSRLRLRGLPFVLIREALALKRRLREN